MIGARSFRGPNAERHARTRAALLRAAREVFARDGFARAKTGEIVALTGLTRGALYYHWPDKLALFDAVVEEVAEEIVARIENAARARADPLTSLRAGCEEWLEAMANPELHRLYLVEGPAPLACRAGVRSTRPTAVARYPKGSRAWSPSARIPLRTWRR